MSNNQGRENGLFIILLIITVIVISCVSPYYGANEACKSIRVKRTEELSGSSDSTSGMTYSANFSFYTHEITNPQAAFEDIILLLLCNKIITFYILLLLLPLYHLYRYIIRRNILVSEVKNKLFLVHYLKRKDGKKNALSFCCSF
jgi:hypothetical protein